MNIWILQREAGLLRRLSWLLAGVCAMGCADSEPPESKPVRYTEHLVCAVKSEGERLQHMYRIDFASPQAEFVGGFGGRILSVVSRQLLVAPDEVRITFAIDGAQPQQEFEVIIQRERLSYLVARNQNQEQEKLYGRCSVLDGQQLRSRPVGLKLSVSTS